MKKYITIAVPLFGIISVGILVATTLSFKQQPAVTIDVPGNALVELQKTVDAEVGMRVPKYGNIIARDQATSFSVNGSQVDMEPDTNIQIKSISNVLLELFSTRGIATVYPAQTINYCTRATCAITSGYFSVNYITPGEIVEYRPAADMVVRFNDALWPLAPGDTIRIDELTKKVKTTTRPHPTTTQ